MARAPKTPKLSTGKASKPELKPLDVHLADLLNPAVNRERAEAAGFAERAQDFIHADLADLGPAPAGGIAETGRRLGADGVSATVQALTKLLTGGNPLLQGRQALDAAPAGAAGEIRRRHPLHASSRNSSRPATSRTAIAELVDGVRAQRARPGAARRHRLGQDLHDGAGHRARRSARR